MNTRPRCRTFELPLLRVELQVTPGLEHERGRMLRTPHDAARVLVPFLEHTPATRRLAMALLDARRRLLAVAVLDGPEWSACCLRPSDVYEPAIVAGAAGMYVAHCHRSDTLWALRSDYQSLAGVLQMSPDVHVDVHDSLIFDARGRYASLHASPWPWSKWHFASSTERLGLSPYADAGDAATHPEEAAHA